MVVISRHLQLGTSGQCFLRPVYRAEPPRTPWSPTDRDRAAAPKFVNPHGLIADRMHPHSYPPQPFHTVSHVGPGERLNSPASGQRSLELAETCRAPSVQEQGPIQLSGPPRPHAGRSRTAAPAHKASRRACWIELQRAKWSMSLSTSGSRRPTKKTGGQVCRATTSRPTC
jgi:hypothetical protein